MSDSILTNPPVFFTTEAEMRTKLGQDFEPESLNAFNGAMSQATDHVWFKLQRVASVERLAASRVVRNWAKVCACYFITADSGETHVASFKEEFDRVDEQLEEVRAGKAGVPDIATVGNEQKGAIPVVSHVAVDIGMMPTMRLNIPASTGQPEGYQVPAFYPTTRRRRYL